MSLRAGILLYFSVMLILTACTASHNPVNDYQELTPTTIMDAPLPAIDRITEYDPVQVERGKYIVELLGCGSCHTDGALVGMPVSSRRLAGSHVGIAYSNPLEQKYPGIVYPANLTPDTETGIGSWTDAEVIDMIRHGIDRHGRQKLSVMPWPAYTRLTEEDATAIVAYLRSLAPVRNRVPDNVAPGNKATEPFVHFGVYQSRP